jgi:hypothetical protein
VIIARLAIGADRAVHRDHQRIARRRADILALEGDRHWQHDVGVARARGPCRLLHDHRIRPRERTMQAAEILVVVKRIAARPVHQPDVRVGQPLSVVVERLARMQQHVGDPRHRDEIGNAVAPRWQRRQGHGERWLAGVRGRAQRIGKAAAR